MMPSIMGATPSGNNSNSPQAVGKAIAQASFIAGIAIGVVFCAAKLIYYGVGWRYLCRPPVRHWLGNPGDEFRDGTWENG